MIFLADRKNAPYGTKTKDELIELVSRDILRLDSYGCRKILIACCTASTVHPYLPEKLKNISTPIIIPTAMAAGGGKRIAVIATRHTVNDSAFSKALSMLSPASSVFEIEAGELVTLAEGGCRDGKLNRANLKIINNITEKIKATDPDTLILGCTHFSHFERTFTELLPNVRIVSSAREGASALIGKIKPKAESGRTQYTE